MIEADWAIMFNELKAKYDKLGRDHRALQRKISEEPTEVLEVNRLRETNSWLWDRFAWIQDQLSDEKASKEELQLINRAYVERYQARDAKISTLHHYLILVSFLAMGIAIFAFKLGECCGR